MQSVTAWQRLESAGVLHTNRRCIDNYFLAAYNWMAEQMRHRLAVRPSETALPLWAWYQWQGQNRRKPDLRASGHLMKGERAVRIEFEIDDRVVLLSDFELWHFVLNYWYLPVSEDDGEAFEKELAKHGLSFFHTKPLPHRKYHERIEKSWRRIFDLDWSSEGIASPRAEKSIQATLWKLRLDQVKNVQEFIAR